MVALFLDDNKTNDDGEGRRTAKKITGFYWQNNKFAGASRYFVQFFSVVAPLRHETSYFHTLALWSRWTQHKSCLFPLLNLDTVLSDSTRGNFANICQIKGRWSLKRCEFTFWRFRSVVIQNFLLPWQRDLTSSPLYQHSVVQILAFVLLLRNFVKVKK